MDGGGGVPIDLDGDVQPNVDGASSRDTSTHIHTEENSSVNCTPLPSNMTSLPLIDEHILSSGGDGKSTKPTDQDIDVTPVTMIDGSDVSAAIDDGLKLQGPKEFQGCVGGNVVVVGVADFAPQPVENDRENTTQVVFDVTSTNSNTDDTSSPSTKEVTSSPDSSPEIEAPFRNTVEIMPTLQLQEEATPTLTSPPSTEEQDDSIMDSIKLTSSVVSVSHHSNNSSIAGTDSPLLPPTPNNESESSWCNDMTADQHQQQQVQNVLTTTEVLAKETTTYRNDGTVLVSGCNIMKVLDEENGDEGEFTVIELVSPSNNSTATSHISTRQLSPNQTAMTKTTTQLECDGDYNLVPTLVDDTMTPLLPPTSTTTATSSQNTVGVHHPPEEANTAYTLSPNPPPLRKKILRHPILTPLTKLPWDRFISAAGACDVLFNCKYSMRQVEDEVREEERKVCGGVYHIGCGGEGEGYGDDCGEGGVEVEQGGSNGREDGYVNVNVGQDCLDYGYDDKDGCDADEFSKLGLDCCSMLDTAVEEEEVEGAGHPTQTLANSDEMGGERWERVTVKREVDEKSAEGDARTAPQPSLSPTPPLRPNIITNDHKAERSWKSSNPSLDMLVYRTMLNE